MGSFQMLFTTHTARLCHEEAGRIYRLAVETKAPQQRMGYLKLAADWDLLAGDIEYRTRKHAIRRSATVRALKGAASPEGPRCRDY